MREHLYHYRAVVQRVYDGDTCTLDLDLGLSVWVRGENVRLARIDAPEVRGTERPEGLVSRDYLRGLVDGREVFVETIRDRRGKYGRYLAEIWIEDDEGTWINVNDHLVDRGYAAYRTY